jgi:acyl-coenzyme A thioesterase PaaI-like protein
VPVQLQELALDSQELLESVREGDALLSAKARLLKRGRAIASWGRFVENRRGIECGEPNESSRVGARHYRRLSV